MRHLKIWSAMLLVVGLLWPAYPTAAQGVTTGAIAGVVTTPDKQPVAGASVVAIHEPSGTVYEATTRPDGRFAIQGMRVGGPYTVTVNYVGSGTAFEPTTQQDVVVNLGVATDLPLQVKSIAVSETVTVTARSDTVFSSARTGAATTVSRDTLEVLPTVGGRINDVTRLTPQASGSSFQGQDNRMNNITVDGSSFNNSFGLGGQPGDRTGVAPISLEAIEQIQVNVAPFDVRQGSFIGAGVNTVTRSGTNRVNGSFYHRFRSEDWVGTEAAGEPVNPGTFKFRNTGGWASGPIIQNRWFAFGNYEDEKDTRPLITFRANNGGEPVAGTVTRVLASDLDTLSSYLKQRFDYDTGPYNNIDRATPAKRFLLRSDYNINNANKVNFRYNYLDSFTDVLLSTSSSAGLGRGSNSQNFLSFQNSNYQLLENIRSGIAEWNAVIGQTMANSLQGGYTYQDESRASRGTIFPFVDILGTDAAAYTSFGFEPFTVNNELRYDTFQVQDNLTKFMNQHSLTFGGYAERYHSENVFWSCCPHGNWTYNSLADFYTDANGYLANPNRSVSPVVARRFRLRYSNLPGVDKPLQPLYVWYSAVYAQDEWRPRTNLTLTGGVRVDISRFRNTAYENPNADSLSFRDETGQPVRYNTGDMPDAKLLWSPRLGINWDVAGDLQTQVRGGVGLFSGRPAYVWISNQLGNTGMLIGEILEDNTSQRPFTPDVSRYKPLPTGAPAASYELNVTDPDFRFPQIWRFNVAVDRRLPLGLVSTTEYIYNRDVNGLSYINANLPAAQSAFVGVDNRPRWAGAACNTNPPISPCVTRVNNAAGNQVTNAFVLRNGNEGRAWSISQTLYKNTTFGLSVRGAYSYGESKNTVDPGSTASTNFTTIFHHGDPNNPDIGYSQYSPGHRVFAVVNYSRRYFEFGATSFSLYWEARHSTVSASSRLSYVFSGDMNGDSFAGNDLIYIPRDLSEMNFVQFTCAPPACSSSITFTPAQQAEAFEAYIQQDDYLRNHRGQYAQRNGVVLPMLRRADFSISQDIFRSIGGRRHDFQIRADFINFFNLLNHDWGVGQRPVASVGIGNGVQVLTNPGADAQGRPNYRLAVVNNQLITRSFQTSTSTSAANTDVYQFMLSLRYTFN